MLLIMFSRSKLFANIILVIGLIVLMSLLFILYQKITEQKFAPLDAIPESTAMFISINSIDSFYDKLDETSIWKNILLLSGLENLSGSLQQFDSILKSDHRNQKLINNQEAIISIHPVKNKMGVLMAIKLSGNQNRKFFNNLFTQAFADTYTTLRTTVDGNLINKLVFHRHEKSFSYVIKGGLFIGSWDENLLFESIKQLASDHKIDEDPDFMAVSGTAGKRVDGNIYINYKNLPGFLEPLANGIHEKSIENETDTVVKNLAVFAKLANWSELDLFVKKDELLLSGYTQMSDSGETYLKLFQNQPSQYFEMGGIIPANATFIQHYGVGNFGKYFSDFQVYLASIDKLETFKKQIDQLNNKLNTDLSKSFVPLIGKEFALVSLARNPSLIENQTYAVIKVNNPVAAKNYLDGILANQKGSGLIKTYRNHQIYQLNSDALVPAIFGSLFDPIQHSYYTLINNYLIIGNSAHSLEYYLNLYLGGQTLVLDKDFISFSDNMAEKSNVYIYYNIKNGLSLVEKFTNEKVFEFILQNAALFKNHQAIGLQYASNPNGLFTNLHINYNSKTSGTNEGVWQARLDNRMVGKPHLLKNHQNKYLYTLVEDADHYIYLIDQHGTRLWKYHIDGPMLGEVFEIDYYKNGKIQYLLNTSKHLYLLDVLGQNVANYPIKLNTQATNGIAVFDYSNDKDYRILYSGTDRKIYNYNIQGTMVDGWNQLQTEAKVETKIQHLVANKRDYILLADVDGNIRIINRLGRDRILLKNQFLKSENAEFYVNETNNKGLFITTDFTGKLNYINSAGNVTYTDFGNYMPQHYFYYVDFSGDGNHDFIFADQQKLKVYDRFRQELLSYQFNSVITAPPLIYQGQDGQILIGIYASADQEVHLFDKNGKLEIGQKISGSTNFSLGDILNNGSINLLIGSNNTLNNFIIQ